MVAIHWLPEELPIIMHIGSRKHRDVVPMGTQPLTQKPIRRVIADGPKYGLAHLRNSIKISSSKGTQTIWEGNPLTRASAKWASLTL